jgi:hypothetical protein
MSKEIKELQRIRSILSYVTGFEDDDQENIEDARKSVGRVIDSLAEQPAQRTWVWLSNEEEKQIKDNCTTVACVLKSVKAKLKAKNFA